MGCWGSSTRPSPPSWHPRTQLLLRGVAGGRMGGSAPTYPAPDPAACWKAAPCSIPLQLPRRPQNSSHLRVLIACQQLRLQTAASLTARPGTASFKQRPADRIGAAVGRGGGEGEGEGERGKAGAGPWRSPKGTAGRHCRLLGATEPIWSCRPHPPEPHSTRPPPPPSPPSPRSQRWRTGVPRTRLHASLPITAPGQRDASGSRANITLRAVSLAVLLAAADKKCVVLLGSVCSGGDTV